MKLFKKKEKLTEHQKKLLKDFEDGKILKVEKRLKNNG